MGNIYTHHKDHKSKNNWIVGVLFFAVFCFTGMQEAEAQLVVVAEPFSTGNPLPTGWQSAKASGAAPTTVNKWERYNTVQTCPNTAGTNVCRYNSRNLTSAAESALLISPGYDMSNRGVLPAQIRIDVFRDCGAAASNEYLNVWVNNSPTITGALQCTGFGPQPNNITRYCAAAPAAAGWVTYTWDIPASVTGGLWSTSYFIVRGFASNQPVCASSADIVVDNISVDTYPSNMVLGAAGLSSQNVSTVASGSTNAEVVGINIVATGSANRITLDSVLFNANGTTNLTNITNAKLYSTGASPF
ncbi:MAG: hypothetical protein HKN22_05700, partial [Bacteroidia bacterium]|nr:hypothetical protein [Bacteroidia bacterium]